MNKSVFKKCLHILDKIETIAFDHFSFYETFLSELKNDEIILTKPEVDSMIQALTHSNNLEHYDSYYDLSECLYIFAKSKHDSCLEAYSIFEALLHDEKTYQEFKNHLNDCINFQAIHSFFIPIIKDTTLFIRKKKGYYFNPSYISQLEWILEDISNKVNCSDCLKVQYTHDLYHHLNLSFKNEHTKIIDYDNINRMKNIFNKNGIPTDRDCSKDLQVFFKDCLFNEFKHSCCICGIDLPHMLIASHIKPFRDCGYIVEAMDSNNGLLLCRNHDYLFDQGYLSFDDFGHIILSNELIQKTDIYNIDKTFQLDSSHMTTSRKKFLKYHRTKYLKK